MGEIGVDRQQYLYDLEWSDLVLIERGYDRRCRHLWSATRWSTFYTLSGFVGGEQMKKSGINSPTDLLTLPWERKRAATGDQPSKEEVSRLRQLMEKENRKLNENNGKS